MKKQITYIFYLILIIANASAQNIDCDHSLPPGQNLFDGKDSNVKPGDTICVTSGFRDFMQFRNISGTQDQAVVIINKGGVVIINSDGSYGIKLNNCNHVKLTGSGLDGAPYGFIIQEVDMGAGITLDNKTTDIEVEKIEVGHVPIAGIYAKTEPDFPHNCTFPAVRDSFTMFNIHIHDCYLHHTGNEGMYIGSSKFGGQVIHHCNDTTVLPHVLEGVKVYNNILENIGWDAIQVSSAVSDCEIYNNLIIKDSNLEENYQMSGILIGGGSDCDCYNNTILNGKGDGIDMLGTGGNKIYNNLIVNAGRTYHPNEPPTDFQKHGIYVGDIFTKPNSDLFVYNNTIISPRTFGIKLANTTLRSTYIQNNLIIDPGAYNLVGDNAYIDLLYSSIDTVENNNFKNTDTTSVKFVAPLDNYYDLKATSPAVNTGADLSAYELLFDIENRIRPFDKDYDIGAWECQDSSLINIPEYQIGNTGISRLFIFPNPFRDKITVEFSINKQNQTNIILLNTYGKVLKTLVTEITEKGNLNYEFNLTELPTGLYILRIRNKYGNESKKIVKY